MPKFYDLARVTVAAAPGLGPLSLGAAIYGFLTFPLAGVQNGDVVTYAINDGTQSEIGYGTYVTSTNVLARNMILASTNGGKGGSKINASATCQVFITFAAEDLQNYPYYQFQSVTTATGTVLSGVTLLAVQRTSPTATALVLPNLALQFATLEPLRITDWSTGVTSHVITLTTPDGTTIMRQTSWELVSNSVQLGSVLLYPSPDLNGWVISP